MISKSSALVTKDDLTTGREQTVDLNQTMQYKQHSTSNTDTELSSNRECSNERCLIQGDTQPHTWSSLTCFLEGAKATCCASCSDDAIGRGTGFIHVPAGPPAACRTELRNVLRTRPPSSTFPKLPYRRKSTKAYVLSSRESLGNIVHALDLSHSKLQERIYTCVAPDTYYLTREPWSI